MKGTVLRQLRDAPTLTAPAAQQWLALFQYHQDAHNLRKPELWPSVHITPATLLPDLMVADSDRVNSAQVAREYVAKAPTMRAHGMDDAELYDMHLVLIPALLGDHCKMLPRLEVIWQQ